METFRRTSIGLAVCSTLAIATMGACGSSDEEGSTGTGGSSGTSGGATASGGSSGSGGGSGSGGQSAGGATSGGTSAGTGGTSAGTGGTSAGTGGTSAGTGGTSAGTGGTSPGTGGSPTVGLQCGAPRTNASVGNACPGTSPPALKLTQVASGLNVPVFVTQAPGDSSRLYVVEQLSGLIRVVKDGAVDPTPFLDIKAVLGGPGQASEQGFLGLAFDPYFETSKRFFVKYSGKTGNGAHVIAEYKVGTNGVADPGSARIILQFDHAPYATGNHNGGMLAFGPDECLYIAVGDGGSGGDPGGRGQSTTDPFGNILRIDVDKYPQAAPGNLSAPAYPHVWDYGLRNPWRFSFDKQTNDLYIGDVGQGAWEEVDVEPSGRGNRNYGWKVMEGTHCYDAQTCDESGKTLPAAEYAHSGSPANNCVIGGYVYRGAKIPGMVGRYIYGDNNSSRIWSFVYKGETNGQPETCDETELTSLKPSGRITSFGQDLAGEVYVVTTNNSGAGLVYRIDPG